jgi:hypothetical protein
VLKTGPGLILRWVAAVPLLALALVVVPIAEEVVWAWGFHVSVPDSFYVLIPREKFDVVAETQETAFSGSMSVLLALLVGLGVFNWARPFNWRWIALAGTAPFAVLKSVAELVDLDSKFGDAKVRLAWYAGGGVVASVVAFGAAALAAFVLSRPLRTDIVRSGIDLTFRTRDGAHLRIRGHSLMLDMLRWPADEGSSMRLSIPFDALTVIQPGTLDDQDTVWPLPNGSTLALSAGPALRVVGSNQQWVVPVADPARVAKVVRERARVRGGAPPPVPVGDPPPVFSSALPSTPQLGPEKRIRPWHTTPWKFDIAVTAALALAGSSVNYALTEDPLGWITVVLSLAMVVGGVRYLRKIRAIRDHADANPRSECAEPWGDYAADQAPLPGWTAREVPA